MGPRLRTSELEELFGTLPQEFRRTAKQLRRTVRSKGATAVHEKKLYRIINRIISLDKAPVWIHKDLRSLSDLIAKKKFKPEMLEKVDFAISKYGKHSHHIIDAIGAFLENPRFDSRLFTKGFCAKLSKTIHNIYDKTRKKDEMRGTFDIQIEMVYRLLKYRNFNVAMLDRLNDMADQFGLRFYDGLSLWFKALDDPKFKPGTIDKKFLDTLHEIIAGPRFSTEMGNSDFVARAIKDRDASIVDIINNYDEAEKVMELLAKRKVARGLASVAELVFGPGIQLNFAYAVTTIGKEKAMELYEQRGIEYFFRYSKETLEEMNSNLKKSKKEIRKKPVALVLYNKYDHNGAFYHEPRHFESLFRGYSVLIVEVGSEKEFVERFEEIGKKYGPIELVDIGGHGTAGSIQLGRREYIDITDRKLLQKLKQYLVADPTVVLESCSTGKDENSVGALISEVWGAHAIAPEVPTSLPRFSVDEIGRLIGTKYYMFNRGDSAFPHAEFYKGKRIPEPKIMYMKPKKIR